MSNALVGLLTLRLPSLGWVILASSLLLRLSFFLILRSLTVFVFDWLIRK